MTSSPELATSSLSHVVKKGESLWGILKTITGKAPVQQLITHFLQINNKKTSRIYPGDVLRIPEGLREQSLRESALLGRRDETKLRRMNTDARNRVLTLGELEVQTLSELLIKIDISPNRWKEIVQHNEMNPRFPRGRNPERRLRASTPIWIPEHLFSSEKKENHHKVVTLREYGVSTLSDLLKRLSRSSSGWREVVRYNAKNPDFPTGSSPERRLRPETPIWIPNNLVASKRKPALLPSRSLALSVKNMPTRKGLMTPRELLSLLDSSLLKIMIDLQKHFPGIIFSETLRTKEVQRALGSSERSPHHLGKAVDISRRSQGATLRQIEGFLQDRFPRQIWTRIHGRGGNRHLHVEILSQKGERFRGAARSEREIRRDIFSRERG